MNIPYDQEAEECVIGACLLRNDAVETSLGMLVASDFYTPSLIAAFQAIKELHSNGNPVDALTVHDQMKRSGVADERTTSDLISMQSNTPALSSVGRYAQIVAEMSAKRQGLNVGIELVDAMQKQTVDVADYLDRVITDIRAIDSAAIARKPDDVSFEEFLARPAESRAPWVTKGLLRQDWRVMLVGREGEGKSVLTLQIATCAAHGVHPFSFKEIDPANVLLVDLENPADVVHQRIKWVTDACERTVRHLDNRNAFLWHRPGGVDLLKRAQRSEFEDVLRRRRPNLVVLGPLYKAYVRKANENDEQVAAEVQSVLDDLRTRYGFALIMEHHAPKGGAGGGPRELVPFGSSLWLRWSELGFSLVPPAKEFPAKTLRIENYRGARVENEWPQEIVWSQPFPWAGRWEKDGGAF